MLRSVRRALKPRYRYNWIRGWVEVDGFKWYVRGTNFPMHHEDWLRKEVEFSGDLFVDVGAHVGTWAVRAAKSFGRVIAFEPDPKWNMMLRKNVEVNSLKNVEVFEIAISSPGAEDKTRTIDSYHLNPTLMKIDTEGAEYKVLEGSAETLKRSRPRLVVETHTQELAGSVKQLLQGHGYKVREIVKVNRWGVPQSYLVCD